MKTLLLFLLYLVCLHSESAKQKTTKINPHVFINPTGTYEMQSKTERVGKDMYGYTGQIRVKLLKDKRIVVGFCICKGAPSYNLGLFLDTLTYNDSIAVYQPVKYDRTCTLTLLFSKNGVISTEQTANYNSGCGFGHAVVANGYFKKVSSKVPTEMGWWHDHRWRKKHKKQK
jgi:hypothetical protein